MDKKNLINLGSGKKPHGLKGDVEFWTASGNETFLEKGHKVWLFPLEGSELARDGQEFTVAQVRRGNQVLLKFEDVPDRTALEKILPFEVLCPREQFPSLPEGTHYVIDLVGLNAVDEAGNVVGRITDFFETPAQLIFTVTLKDGGSMDLPYVKQFFPSVDLVAGTITVNLPEVVE